MTTLLDRGRVRRADPITTIAEDGTVEVRNEWLLVAISYDADRGWRFTERIATLGEVLWAVDILDAELEWDQLKKKRPNWIQGSKHPELDFVYFETEALARIAMDQRLAQKAARR